MTQIVDFHHVSGTKEISCLGGMDVTARSSESATLTSSVYGLIRHDVIAGALLPGQKLGIESLRTRYDVRNTPIREALNRLSAEGLVIQSDGKGFHVSPVSLAELKELTLTRCWVNEIALREAIDHADEVWEETIIVALHRLEREPIPVNDGSSYEVRGREERHRAFHAALIAACPSQLLRDFSATLFDRADRYRSLTRGRPPIQPRDTRGEHRAITEATLARDTATATRLLNEHAVQTADHVAMIVAAESLDPFTPEQHKRVARR